MKLFINKITYLISPYWIKRALFLFGITLVFLVASNWWIKSSTDKYIYSDITSVPYNKVGLVLGASKSFSNGSDNPYFTYRVEAAAELFFAGKVDLLILSGDNSKSNYNEPEDMLKALVNLGVPKTVITLDYAGFRTFDSMVRLKKVFGQSHVTIVSQKFHLQRALYIARQFHINAVGFEAKQVRSRDTYQVREFLAKGKSVLDCWIIFKQPHFLGHVEKLNGDF
ncbi:MAG: SanA protein [Flavobacteriales bacterium]|jgi:SanA protein